MGRARALLIGAGLALGACSGVRGLSDTEPMTLSPAERRTVASQIDRAVAAKEWAAAWDQAVLAGADRERFESLAVKALADDDRDAAAMFRELRRKWGGITPATRAEVDALIAQAEEEGAWGGALDLALLTADDRPEFAAAWAVYERAPSEEQPGLLETIHEVRAEGAEGEDGD